MNRVLMHECEAKFSWLLWYTFLSESVRSLSRRTLRLSIMSTMLALNSDVIIYKLVEPESHVGS